MSSKENDDLDEEEQAGWMTTYSDMMTLLLTFFVLLFAISNVDAHKFSLLAAGLSKNGMSVEQFLEIKDTYNLQGDNNADPDNIKIPAGENSLDALHTLVLNYVDEHGLEESVAALYDGNELLLTLTNDIWFVSGSAEVTEEMKEKAILLGRLLRDQNVNQPFDIIVAGHTDNVPINTNRYPSNWDLSVDRAVKFLRILISESGLSPDCFSARGCGEELPIADNDTPEGRQQNRRVEVLITQASSKE